jgi:hypothetical protein
MQAQAVDDKLARRKALVDAGRRKVCFFYRIKDLRFKFPRRFVSRI